MKYDSQRGRYLTIPAPAGGVVSGKLVVVGSLIGFAHATAAAGEDVVIDTEYCGDYPKTSALAIAVGDKVYFDAANNVVNKTSAGNTFVGIAIRAAANPSDLVGIKLGPTTV